MPGQGIAVELTQLVAELKRRRVIRALVGYGIAAFVVLQVAEPIIHGLRLPDQTMTYVVVTLALGFPLVVSLAWIFDVNAGVVERTPAAAGMQGPRLVVVLVAIGVIAAAPGLTYFFVWPGHLRPRGGSSAAQRTPSIAVLPFADMSAA